MGAIYPPPPPCLWFIFVFPEYRQDVMQKSDLAFSMAIRPCDFDDDEPDVQLPDWDAVRLGDISPLCSGPRASYFLWILFFGGLLGLLSRKS